MNAELQSFIRASLEKGIKRDQIRSVLLGAGWQEDEIAKALSLFADVDFPVPVPRPRPYLDAKEAFLYLVSFITLYISAFSFGALVFSFIDLWFPDAARYGYYDVSRSGLRMSISSLIVAFPLYVWITLRLRKARIQDPERRESKVRKWLVYLTLVIASSIIIGDLISILFNLLGGELTIRFLFKALTVLLITSAIFGYHLSDFRKEEKEIL